MLQAQVKIGCHQNAQSSLRQEKGRIKDRGDQ